MRRFTADLHIHTALSPCAMAEMTPPAIVRAAAAQGLDMIAICDHNSARNAAAVQEAAGDALAVIAGIEITTSEEVHVVGLFPDAAAAGAVGARVSETLPENDAEAEERFGRQSVLDAAGREVATEPRMLSAASTFPLQGAVALIHGSGGVAIAAHADRPSFSVQSQLGIFPVDAGLDGIEISAAGRARGRENDFSLLALPIVASSDSHFLSDLGSCSTRLDVDEATFYELALALQGIGGRRCVLA
ncbi:MAG: PHP domain-containing protein [Candidatus Hydrogenedentes bacterium]|nr:PHP domain-containing protein [Candidatus Hydrogenedentota bacterium]